MAYYDPDIETMPRERLRELQLEKLQALLAQIYGRNRFYTAKFKAAGVVPQDIRSLADLSRLPFRVRDEMVQAQADDPPFGTNATFPISHYDRCHASSGTTGKRLWRPVDSRNRKSGAWAMGMTAAGLTAEDRVFVAGSFGPYAACWGGFFGAMEIGAMALPGGGMNSRQRLHMMRELGATAMCTTPSYALRLAEVASEEGIPLSDIPMRAVLLAGEPGANVPATRARIEEAWIAECFDQTGGVGAGKTGFECEVHPNGVHLIESSLIAEVLDPTTDEPVPPGQPGELVVTSLDNVGFPNIRSRTGDQVILQTEPCACGRTFWRLKGGILGRIDDALLVRGVIVMPRSFENVIRRFPEVVEFAGDVYQQGEVAELEIRVEVDGVEPDALAAAIAREIHDAVGLRVQVTPVPYGSLPRFGDRKARRFTDHRRVASRQGSG
jgi:phenylacetate-CoA ligase